MNKFNYATGSGPLKRFDRPESIGRWVFDNHLPVKFL
jgi:hypothetical protein